MPISSPPGLRKNAVRIYTLGGVSKIGRNMTVIEHRGQILIVDCGVLFPGEEQPGVDLILPDFGIIENRLNDIVGLVLTHGHEDHIGAVPYLLRLKPDIPLIGSAFTLALTKAKCDEHRIRPQLVHVTENHTHTCGFFELEFLAVNHSIPDALAVGIKVGGQQLLHTGDVKLDQLPLDGRLTDLAGFARLGASGVDLFLAESTNAQIPGFGMGESEIAPALNSIISQAPQRVILATFASNVHRVQQVINIAHHHGRKIIFAGRSMLKNMKIAQDLGYLTVPENTIITSEQAQKLPPNKVLCITTGSQGENLAALSRMARGEYKHLTVEPGDHVILASSLIPGNENQIFSMVNELAKRGLTVTTPHNAKVHVSGHAYAGELLFLHNAVKPKNFMPIHGEFRHLQANAELAISTGVPRENVFLTENGTVLDLEKGTAHISGKYPVGQMYVDGLAMGDIGENTLSDRTILGEGGFISITVAVDSLTGKTLNTPTVTGRGFSDDETALEKAIQLVRAQVNQLESEEVTDTARISQQLRRTVGRWVAEEYRRRPMIVANIIAVNTPTP